MKSRFMKRFGVLIVAAVVACSEGSEPLPDEVPDAGPAPDAFVPPDPGRLDAGFEGPDEDAGFLAPTVQEGLQPIGGVNLYTHVRGTLTSTLPPVIFINTGPFLGHEYLLEPMAFLLGPQGAEPDRLHIYYDMRATGRSSFGNQVDVASHVEDLGAIMDWVDGFTETTNAFDVIGHGYGAGIAVLYAADRPERLNHMVLITPHPADIDQHVEWYAEWNARLSTPERERIQQIILWTNCISDVLQCSLDYWDTIGPGWLCPENEPLFNDMRFEYLEMRLYWSQGLINEDLRAQQFDWRPQMGRVRTPTTIIAGACDPIPAEAAQVYTSSVAGATLHVFDESGHFPFVESPARFQRIVKQALTD